MLGAPVDSVNKLFVFGVKCFVKVDNASRRALQPKARAGVYIGYHDISDSHRVLVKNQTRFAIVDSVHVQVHERELGMPAVLAGERARLSPVAALIQKVSPQGVKAESVSYILTHPPNRSLD
jgi:hypothetical protein